MKRYVQYVIVFIVLTLNACAGKTDSLLEDMTGVWRAKNDGAMVSVIYSDNKMRMLIGDDAIATTLGDIDNENKTVNLNVTLQDGKPGIWTLKQVWDKEHKSFYLSFTLHDGVQDELSFVRKISTDDLNKIAKAETKNNSASISSAATTSTEIEQAPEIEPTVETSLPEEAVVTEPLPTSEPSEQMTFSPSFDCAKASTGAERLVCSNKELASLDVQMMTVYKKILSVSSDKNAEKKVQNDWLKNERNICATSECMVNAYQTRLAQAEQYLSKPAEFR